MKPPIDFAGPDHPATTFDARAFLRRLRRERARAHFERVGRRALLPAMLLAAFALGWIGGAA